MSKKRNSRPHTAETKRKISESKKGKRNPMYGKTGIDSPCYGITLSKETKRKISEAHRGKLLSEEHKRKISEARRGKRHTEETRRKMSEAQSGVGNGFYSKHHTEEAKRRMSEARKGEKNHFYGKHHTEEAKRKMSKAERGKRHTEETKRKMSEISKERWKDEEYAKRVLKRLSVRPTSYEQCFIDFCEKHNLPFRYTGDGSFLIGSKNPDFVDCERKIAVEVFCDYFKIKEKGGVNNYKRERQVEFAKRGWTTIFLGKNELFDEDKLLNTLISSL